MYGDPSKDCRSDQGEKLSGYHGSRAAPGGTSYLQPYSDDEREFLVAVDRYKREHHRPFPSWQEVFGVLVSLGYRKVAEPAPAKPFIRSAYDVIL